MEIKRAYTKMRSSFRGVLSTLIMIGLLAFSVPVHAYDIPQFQPHPDNPIINRVQGLIRLYKVSDTEFRHLFKKPFDDYATIFLETSSDGLNFGGEVGPVIDSSVTGKPRNKYIGELKIGGTYHAWIAALNAETQPISIFYATSSDGVTYQGHGEVLANDQPYDAGKLEDPWPVIHNGTIFLFHGVSNSSSGGTMSVALATASDPSGPWTKHGEKVLRGGPYDTQFASRPTVVKNGSLWEMYYAAGDYSGNSGTAYAVSTDGYTWQKVGMVNSLPAGAIPIGAFLKDGKTYLYHTGSGGVHLSITTGSPPVANAGPDIAIDAQEQSETVVIGSASDADGDALEFRWLEGVDVMQGWQSVGPDGACLLDLSTLEPLKIRPYYLTLEVRDSETTASDEMLLTVQCTGNEEIIGGNGDDELTGTQCADNMDGRNGDDTLYGLGGNDIIDGGNGRDIIYGGEGNDTIDGGNSNDQLFGQNGDDAINGKNGNDVIEGGEGNDNIEGKNGNDQLAGGPGNDIIDGSNGQDIIFGDEGNDNILGGNGNDQIDGGPGDDTLVGGNGNDTLIGGLGNDIITGDRGNDTIDGGVGTDTAVFDGDLEEFLIEVNADGSITVSGGGQGVDILVDVEVLRFNDEDYIPGTE